MTPAIAAMACTDQVNSKNILERHSETPESDSPNLKINDSVSCENYHFKISKTTLQCLTVPYSIPTSVVSKRSFESLTKNISVLR